MPEQVEAENHEVAFGTSYYVFNFSVLIFNSHLFWNYHTFLSLNVIIFSL